MSDKMQEIPDLTSHFVVPVQPIFQNVIGNPIRTTTVTIAVQIDSGLHRKYTCHCLSVRADSAAAYELAMCFWQAALFVVDIQRCFV